MKRGADWLPSLVPPPGERPGTPVGFGR
jgi:hypothetical protein